MSWYRVREHAIPHTNRNFWKVATLIWLSNPIYSPSRWLNPIFSIGLKRSIEDDDVYAVTNDMQSELNTEKFAKLWDEELQKKKPSILRVLFKLHLYKLLPFGILYATCETIARQVKLGKIKKSSSSFVLPSLLLIRCLICISCNCSFFFSDYFSQYVWVALLGIFPKEKSTPWLWVGHMRMHQELFFQRYYIWVHSIRLYSLQWIRYVKRVWHAVD